MTGEEAITIIGNLEDKDILYNPCDVQDAKTMAIKALEQEPSVEIVKTEESNDNDTKYLNINVSDDEVKRNPDIVRLCSDVGILEYMKPKTDVLDKIRAEIEQTPTQVWEENKTTYILASYYKKQVLDIIGKYREEQE